MKRIQWLWQIWPETVMVLLAWPMGIVTGMGIGEMIKLTILLIGQNASFTFVSRARQSANLKLHALAAIGSNGFFIFVVTTVVAHYTNVGMKFWYVVCTVVGSVHAHYLALHKVEKSRYFQKDSLVSRAELDQKLAEFARTHQLSVS